MMGAADRWSISTAADCATNVYPKSERSSARLVPPCRSCQHSAQRVAVWIRTINSSERGARALVLTEPAIAGCRFSRFGYHITVRLWAVRRGSGIGSLAAVALAEVLHSHFLDILMLADTSSIARLRPNRGKPHLCRAGDVDQGARSPAFCDRRRRDPDTLQCGHQRTAAASWPIGRGTAPQCGVVAGQRQCMRPTCRQTLRQAANDFTSLLGIRAAPALPLTW
jgi:hypothetical protein